MSVSEKARRNILVIEIPRDELAFRIATACVGLIPIGGNGAKEALDEIRSLRPDLADAFYSAADAAVEFFHECLTSGSQPS